MHISSAFLGLLNTPRRAKTHGCGCDKAPKKCTIDQIRQKKANPMALLD